MGMIQTLIRKVPDGEDTDAYLADVIRRLPSFAEGAEHSAAGVLTETNFEEHWANQENLKNEPAIREKYLGLAKARRVVFVEIDW